MPLRPMRPLMLLRVRMARSRQLALVVAPPYQLMPFHPPRPVPTTHASCGIRMHIHAPVHPRTPPRTVVDEKSVRAPVKPAVSPAPWPKETSNRDAKSKADRSAHKETRPWRSVNHERI